MGGIYLMMKETWEWGGEGMLWWLISCSPEAIRGRSSRVCLLSYSWRDVSTVLSMHLYSFGDDENGIRENNNHQSQAVGQRRAGGDRRTFLGRESGARAEPPQKTRFKSLKRDVDPYEEQPRRSAS